VPDVLQSSTIYISETIKVLDMSLPTYDDVKSSKASVSNVKSLYVDPKSNAGVVTSGQQKKQSSSYSSSINSSTTKQEKPVKVGEYNF
jgi:hypothetical protein